MSQDGAFQEKRELFINFATFHFPQNETETIPVSVIKCSVPFSSTLTGSKLLKQTARF